DKLRYKVEDNIVKIFITPYKTSISEEDLEFSQGDVNVDLVVALGVVNQEDLDEAITAHGRILHDATVASINVGSEGGVGNINWREQASSLSELVADLAKSLGDNLLDEQIATCLMTGIVAETDRFSNDRTNSQTMSISADLMSAGANQQLIATKLDEPPPVPEVSELDDEPEDEAPKEEENAGEDAGMLEIEHVDEDNSKTEEITPPADLPPAEAEAPSGSLPELPEEDNQQEDTNEAVETLSNDDQPPGELSPGPKLITEPPALGGELTASSKDNVQDPVTDPMSLPASEPPQILTHKPESMLPDTPSAAPETTQPAPSTEPAPPPTMQPAPGIAPLSPPPSATPVSESPAPEATQPLPPSLAPSAPLPGSYSEDGLQQIQIDKGGTLSRVGV
ncbi:MAG: hypothetical protein ACREHG_10475, partial [Candidatus Saccharimonadales bacterium]